MRVQWGLAVLTAGAVAAQQSPAAGSTGQSGSDELTPADIQNRKILGYLGWVWMSLFAAFLAYQLALILIRHVRTIACLNNDTQRFFTTSSPMYGDLKKHVLDAPLFGKRHNREFRLSSAVNIGTLPTRLQTLLLGGYLGMNVAYCVVSIDWSGEKKTVVSALRNRTGILAVLNMLPLFLFAGRNNPLVRTLGISFDTFNLMHRWIGRIVVLESLAHTVAWTINKVDAGGWDAVSQALSKSQLILTGTIGMGAALGLLLQSPSILRHAFYETFLHIHIALAAVMVLTVWVHLNTIPTQRFMVGVIAFWLLERLTRLYRIVRHNVGSGGTVAEVEAMSGDTVRVKLRLARPWTFRPGQHIYLYLPSIGWWTSHPFSVAWSEEEEELNSEKGLVMNTKDVLSKRKTSMSLIIRCRTGFTEKLFRKAELSPSGKFTASAYVEGPYGGDSLHSYGTVILFAGGVGITHQLPHVRDLVGGFANGTVATRKVVLVWVLSEPEHLEWVRPWMAHILNMARRRDVLKILLFVTSPRSNKEVRSPSASVQMSPGRPDIANIIDVEMQSQVGAMAVSVCGTGSLADDVRKTVRERHGAANVDFVEHAFSW